MAGRNRPGLVQPLAGARRAERVTAILFPSGRNDWRRLCRLHQSHIVSVLRTGDRSLDLIFYTGTIPGIGNRKGIAGSMRFTATRKGNQMDYPCRPGDTELFTTQPDPTWFCRLRWRICPEDRPWRHILPIWIWRRKTTSRITFIIRGIEPYIFWRKKCPSTTLLMKTVL